MKKTLSLIFALASIVTNASADGMTAILQQGDSMTPFYGISAFQQAYAAAPDSGAVITLSPGAFTPVTTISKSITIIGTYGMTNTSSTSTIQTDVTISADNVTLEGIYFSGTITLGGVKNCHIKRCYIATRLTSSANHTNTRINQCVVKNDNAVSKGYNYSINNSTIEQFSAINTTSNKAYIANCYIYQWAYNSSTSSSTWSSSNTQPYATYINNVLGIYRTGNRAFSTSVVSEFYNNVFLGHYGKSSGSYTLSITYPEGCINRSNTVKDTTSAISYIFPNTTADWGMGVDETPIGTTGGQGFVAYPSIPRITSSTIDTHTNAEGKINVNVKVTVPE